MAFSPNEEHLDNDAVDIIEINGVGIAENGNTGEPGLMIQGVKDGKLIYLFLAQENVAHFVEGVNGVAAALREGLS